MQRLSNPFRAFAFPAFAVLWCGGFACAQDALSDAELAATKSHEQWFTLASTLETRLTRMAPCATGVTTAIEEAQRASTVRMSALIAYTQAVVARAASEVATARQLERSEADYVANLKVEAADTEQERAAIESQIAALAESVRRRVSLTSASDELRALEASVKERAALAVTHATASEAALPRFDALTQALMKRGAALRKQVDALENERAKWNGYYSARMGRAMVECTETGR